MAMRSGGATTGGRSRGGDSQTARAMDEFDQLAGLRGRAVYVLEHLATFTVTRETGIVYPADGMRRLLQLEKTNGIWSQKMQLCLEDQWVLVMDYETGSIMERFPATWVHSPTAFTSPEPAELYNNVLAFVVGAPESGGGSPGGSRRELHIFQCHDVSAQTLVEELNALKGVGSGGSEGGRDFVIEREREREREAEIDRPRRQQMSAQLGRERGGSGGERDDASSTGSERLYEQDIAILNRCFDDIEKFIARLQHAAAASRELERRRRSRSGKRGAAGEGMLALRTRPPPERDFVDVLQKFKLSFNLLARLRTHIHDPNAPELVHFLFTPLALIVDAAQDVADGRLPSRVVQPLLTRDALNLLANCVTSKETELWHSLGDAWLIPREQWKTTIPPYQPVFMDGWTPDYQVDDQPLRRNARGITRAEDSESAASSPEREAPYRPIERERDDDDLGEAWAQGVAARGGRVVRVTYPRTANNDKELTVVRGEYLEVLDDSRKWWKARNRRGVTAHVPHTIVAPAITPPSSPHLYPNPIYTHYQEGASGGRGSGGSSPTAAAEKPIPPPPPPPPPPPEPPVELPKPTTKSDTIKSTKSIMSTGSGLHEELKAVLPQIQRRLEIKKTPDIFIHQKSTPDEVVSWLEAKGFSRTAQKQLRVSGHQLFALSRVQLERVLGTDEGKRLYSQVLVQRNISGYRTTSASELQSILRKVREKVEVS
ncbi:unnamed protein product [Leptosia nina]|uniref:SH3 domain-containing protein n=1 Tax=Leptosia nina TaxID=320188 RepID=A0AAV1JCW5_9NEOP